MRRHVIFPTADLVEQYADPLNVMMHSGIPLMALESLILEYANDSPELCTRNEFDTLFVMSLEEYGFDTAPLKQRGVLCPVLNYAYALFEQLFKSRNCYLNDTRLGHFVSGVSYNRRLGNDLVLTVEISSIGHR